MLNQQPIEKRKLRGDGKLVVHSIFHTIQGEGPFSGTPCVFIRLTGCNLQCPACDTDYTSVRQLLSPDEIVEMVMKHRRRGLVVITGGEPFRQDITELCTVLIVMGFYVQIETNGTLQPLELPYNQDTRAKIGVYVICSPKTGKINEDVFDIACGLKYVLQFGNIREEDGLPLQALEHTASPYPARPPKHWNRPIYIQPMDAKNPEDNMMNIKATVQSCLRFGYTLALQVHKYIGVD